MSDRFSLRRSRLLALMEKKGLKSMLVTNFINVTYLTGFTGDDSYLWLEPERAILLSDSRYALQINDETTAIEGMMRRRGERMAGALSRLIARLYGKKKPPVLGVEAESMTLRLAEQIGEAVPALDLLPVSSLVESLREIKDRTEIAAIRRSIHCAVAGFEAVRRELDAEMSETDVRDRLEYQMRLAGADDRGFPTIAAVGDRAALPHAVPVRTHKVGDGELLLIDWGAKKELYVSDLTRVLITGRRPSRKLKKIYDIVLAAQKAAIQTMRPGAIAEQVDAAAREVIDQAGYGKAFGHGLGHGLGLVVHDRGGLSVGNKTVLRPGMVLTVEPGIYEPGWGGVRIEDDLLVTRDGAKILSAGFPKEFDEMIVEA